MAQKYTTPLALERMEAGCCPECGERPEVHLEDNRFWLPRKCSLMMSGVIERIKQFDDDLRATDARYESTQGASMADQFLPDPHMAPDADPDYHPGVTQGLLRPQEVDQWERDDEQVEEPITRLPKREIAKRLKVCTLAHGTEYNARRATVYGHAQRTCIRIVGTSTWIYSPGASLFEKED